MLDLNDNAPRFTRILHASVAEDAAPGTLVIRATATDPDSAPNAQIRYSIDANASDDTNNGGTFRVDPQTGEVVLAKRLNAKLVCFYIFS